MHGKKVILTLWTESQHWTGPVLQLPADVGVEAGAVTVTVVDGPPFALGMAAARMLRESAQKTEVMVRLNMVGCWLVRRGESLERVSGWDGESEGAVNC